MENARSYKGIEYIRISDLPRDQQDQVRNIVSVDLVIKIKTDTTLLPDCILYKDYVKWYETIYTKMSPAESGALPPGPPKVNFLSRLMHKLLPNP